MAVPSLPTPRTDNAPRWVRLSVHEIEAVWAVMIVGGGGPTIGIG